MILSSRFVQSCSITALSLAACAGIPDAAQMSSDRDKAIAALQREAGAPIALELGATDTIRTLTMTPGFPVPGRAIGPGRVAIDFLATYHDAFQLDAAAAAQFIVMRVDNDRAGDLRHVTLQRTFADIPVFQGAITVHMDGSNGVFCVLGDEFYRIAAPTHRMILSPAEA